MDHEDVQKRLMEAYDYLYSTGKIHSVTELADKMNRSRPSVSRALNGVPEYLNEKFIKAFTDTFQMISFKWLINGNCDMFTQWAPDGVIDNPQHIDQSSLINAALAAKDETITSQKETIASQKETIASLRETIESLKRENATLRQQLGTYQAGEMFDHHPFPMGVADKDDNIHARV